MDSRNLAPKAAAGILSRMTAEDARERLAELKRLRKRAEAAQAAATAATEPAVLYALQQRLGPTEIANLGYVSDGYVRGVRRKHGLPANPSYANLAPPRRVKKAADAPPAAALIDAPSASVRPISIPRMPDEIRQMPKPRIDSLVAELESLKPDWVREVRREIEGDESVGALWRDYVLVAAAVDSGHLSVES